MQEESVTFEKREIASGYLSEEEGTTFRKREISSLTHVCHLEGSGGHLNSIFCFSF